MAGPAERGRSTADSGLRLAVERDISTARVEGVEAVVPRTSGPERAERRDDEHGQSAGRGGQEPLILVRYPLWQGQHQIATGDDAVEQQDGRGSGRSRSGPEPGVQGCHALALSARATLASVARARYARIASEATRASDPSGPLPE